MTVPRAPGRRRFLAAAIGAVGVCVSLAACASTFPFIPDHYTFSRGDVQKAVARKFPYQKTVAQVVDVSLANPAVNLLPDQNRVAVQLDANFASPFLRGPVSGKFTVSGQLAYDAPSRSVVAVVTPPFLPAAITGASRGPTSVLRLRTARSRQMPLRVLAEWR